MSRGDDEKKACQEHDAAMTIVFEASRSFLNGCMSWNRAKSIIDDALIGEADRIVRIGSKVHTPEIES
jgi:hypothetical protein